MPRRVAITGIGPVTPIGIGLDEFWTSLIEGRSGIGKLTRFDASAYTSQIAGEVKDFDVERWLPPRRARRHERFSQLAFGAASLALEHSGINKDEVDPGRVGIVIGTGIGGIALFEEEHRGMLEKGPRFVSPELIAMMIPNAAAGAMAIELGFTGPNECTVTACASSGHAIARAFDLITNGAADVIIAGGSEAAITPLALASFCSARALSTRNDDPDHASRPFDKDRDGFVFSEGAAVIIMEELETAKARGATVLGEVLGYGASADAYHIVAPHPDGAGAAASMDAALRSAGLTPSDVDYINAHGTSTPLGDVAEVKAIKKIFGDSPPPVSSTKSMTGHLLGAAGSLEVAATVLAMQHGILPPTINLESLDPECDIDVVPNKARQASPEVSLSNSFGFGGHNVSIVLAKAA